MTAGTASLRFSRDRRGYEHFYLVQTITNRRGKNQSRILYWFRTPPGVKVGRPPFDPEMQRAIEAHNPGVVFDWPRLLATPIPPPSADVERWRDRRRAERAEKAARAARDADRTPDADSEIAAADLETAAEAASDEAASGADLGNGSEIVAASQLAGESESVPADTVRPDAVQPVGGKRRRRRRGRRRKHGAQQPAAPQPGPTVDDPDHST